MTQLTDINSEQLFKFPLSTEGIQKFTSIPQMKQTFLTLFHQTYGHSSTIKWTFYFYKSKAWQECNLKYKQKLDQIWKMKCNICTNIIIYGKRFGFQEYVLLKINYYHLHTTNAEKYLWYLKDNSKYRNVMRSIKPSSNNREIDEETLISFMRNLPNNVFKSTKFWIVSQHFGVSYEYFEHLSRKINKGYQISFKQLHKLCIQKHYQVRYLPEDLLEDQSKRTQTQISFTYKQQLRNSHNPLLPNILLIVTPQMKQQYRKFGQWVGFDLTFSVISERTQQNGQYMLGVLASSNNCKKIVVFGLVVTNSQSSFAYSFIFRSFFDMMKSVPQVIISDEEKGIYFALQSLKKQGAFTGVHLFDMFHVLRKFKKKTQKSGTFLLFTSLIHAKNRTQYRKKFHQLLENIVNDEELQLLRNFDKHSQKYCFAQIPPKFVGIGVSNNVNEYFHSLIKNQIPYATNFIKAVQIVLQVIAKRLEYSHRPTTIKHPYDSILHMSMVSSLKTLLSEKVYTYLIKQVSLTPMNRILTTSEIRRQLLLPKNFHFHSRLNHNFQFVDDTSGIFLVQKKKQSSKSTQKWSCCCQLTQRCGYPCSHLIKILLKHNEQFLPFINKRWLLDQQLVQNQINNEHSKLKMRKPYVQKIYKQQEGQIKHYDINGYKSYKKKKGQQSKSKKIKKTKIARQQQSKLTCSQQENHTIIDDQSSTIQTEQNRSLISWQINESLYSQNQINLQSQPQKTLVNKPPNSEVQQVQQQKNKIQNTNFVVNCVKKPKRRAKKPLKPRYSYKPEHNAQGGVIQYQRQKMTYQLLLQFQ